MIKVFVDSGSSIKKEEREVYGVEVLPLKVLLGDVEYLDSENLSMETFYNELINNNVFPKTSLPSLETAETKVNEYLEKGYEVLILTISSQISGTYNAIKMLFNGNEKVRVIDTQTLVGGIKILVKEANKYLDKSLDFVEEKLNALIPRIRAFAVPDTLEYLYRGGRLSRTAWLVGSILKIKPILELRGGVKVAGKTIGLKSAMRFLVEKLNDCDTAYPIVPTYTYGTENLDELVSRTSSSQKQAMIDYDNITPAIAAHWGTNAFGFIYVEKE